MENQVGYWGYFIVARTECHSEGLSSFSDVKDHLGMARKILGGWQVWEHPGEPGIDADVLAVRLAQETSAPAMIGFVMDGDCVVIEASAPASGSWTACLGPRMMAGYLSESGHRIEDWFLSPEEASSRMKEWANEAGLNPQSELPVEIFRVDIQPWAQDKFFELLEEIGLNFSED